MAKSNCLKEDKTLPKLPIIFSTEVSNKIDEVFDFNKNDDNALSQFNDYIEGLKSYISNPVIAWDNMGRYQHSANGQVHIRELGYDVTFIIDVSTDKNFVYVIELKLKTKDCEWKLPPYLDECLKISILNKHPKQISDNEYCHILMERYDAHWHRLFR